jgi:V8-like Glu-specific endopeptidase
MKNAVCLFAVFASVSCSAPSSFEVEDATPESISQPIYGGVANAGDPEVYALSAFGSPFCTATRIGERTLLCAAHCADPQIIGFDVREAVATNRADGGTSGSYEIEKFEIHPGWSSNGNDEDVSLLLLKTKPAGPVKAWAFNNYDAIKPTTARLVGYGQTEFDDGGTKRQVTVNNVKLTPKTLWWDQTNGKGACHGDSGGPAFFTFPDGVERVIGITSHALDERDCDGGAVYMRTDAYKEFIAGFLAENETATCASDAMCKASGCTPIDPDCACASDSECSPLCPNQLDDPDCPRDCVANNVCADQTTIACAQPDPDCTPIGEECVGKTECGGRVCVSDPQSDNSYCSSACKVTADCSEGYECADKKRCTKKQLPEVKLGETCTAGKNVCEDGAKCIDKICAQLCTYDDDCAKGFTCSGEKGDDTYCVEKKIEKTPAAPTTPQATPTTPSGASGCSGTSSSPTALVVVALALLLRRRRQTR